MQTVEQIRAQVAAAKLVAMRNFKRTWGTDNTRDLIEPLRQAIPGSKSPADAACKAREILRRQQAAKRYPLV